jgi:hypothetical protein
VRTLALRTCAALLLAAISLAAAEPELAWDQAKVTALGADFSKAVDGLYRKANLESVEPKGAASRADVYIVVEDLQQLRRCSSRFADDLGEGKGRDDTMPLFERMLDIVQRFRGVRQKTPILLDATAEIEAARELLLQLTRYYGAPPPPPVTVP